MNIRTEQPNDSAAVRQVNESAFETAAEADLVERLHEEAYPLISLVADVQDEIVGHIMFSPVLLSGHPELKLMGLAPMAVLPALQNRGIGSALVQAGLEACEQLGVGAVVVLGHPDYYPRFGFVPGSHFGIDCEYDVPSDVFMVRELQTGYLRGLTGTIHYHAAFGEV